MTESTLNAPEKAPEDLENTVKTPENGPKSHLNYAARLVVSPTFDTETGERKENQEYMEYKCTSSDDCEWNTTAYDTGEAGFKVMLHALGLDNLKIDFKDVHNIVDGLNFNPDNPVEVLEVIKKQREAEEAPEADTSEG